MALAPTPEAMLLVVCMHGAHEEWTKLSQVADATGLVQTPGLDWELVLRTARRWKQTRALLIGLDVCRQLVGVELPSEVSASITRDGAARRLADTVVHEFLSPRHNATTHTRAKWRFERQSRDNVVDRIQCLIRQALTPSVVELNLVRLPPWLWWFYLLLRPCRLAWAFLSNSRFTARHGP